MSLDTPDPIARPRKSGLPWLDMIVSICALVTSAVSIFMSVQTGNSMENLVHANSWPFLQIGSGNTTDEGARALDFAVSNAGTGPARIYASEFLVDGRPMDRSNLFLNIARACCATELQTLLATAGDKPFDAIGSVMTSPVAPKILAAHDDIHALRWSQTARNAALWTAMDQARQHGRIVLRACYCSVFDECWTGETEALPKPHRGVCQEQRGLMRAPS